MNRILTLAIVALTLASVPASSHHACDTVTAQSVAATIYIDVHDYTFFDPTSNPDAFVGTVPADNEVHIYMESNGIYYLQRSSVPTASGRADTYGEGCTDGDTLLY